MFLSLQLFIVVVAIQSVSSLKCYISGPPSDGTPVLGTLDSSMIQGGCNNSTCTCISYKFKCSMNDTACTTQQLQNQVILWAHTLAGNDTCQMMVQSPTVYMNVTCCYTDLCNNQGISAISTTVISMVTTSSPNSTAFLSFSLWIVLLALIFCS